MCLLVVCHTSHLREQLFPHPFRLITLDDLLRDTRRFHKYGDIAEILCADSHGLSVPRDITMFPSYGECKWISSLSHTDGERDHNNRGERKEFCVWCCFPPAQVSKCDMISLIKTWSYLIRTGNILESRCAWWVEKTKIIYKVCISVFWDREEDKIPRRSERQMGEVPDVWQIKKNCCVACVVLLYDIVILKVSTNKNCLYLVIIPWITYGFILLYYIYYIIENLSN